MFRVYGLVLDSGFSVQGLGFSAGSVVDGLWLRFRLRFSVLPFACQARRWHRGQISEIPVSCSCLRLVNILRSQGPSKFAV